MQSFTISIPCKTYIRKYFNALYAKDSDAIVLNNRSSFGDTILTKLCYKPVRLKDKKEFNISFGRLDDKIKFQLPFDLFYRIQKDITEQQQYNVNRFLQHTFETDLLIVIQIAEIFGVEKTTAIKSFIDKYDIILDEEIALDSLSKQITRAKKSPTVQGFFLAEMSSHMRGLSLRAL